MKADFYYIKRSLIEAGAPKVSGDQGKNNTAKNTIYNVMTALISIKRGEATIEFILDDVDAVNWYKNFTEKEINEAIKKEVKRINRKKHTFKTLDELCMFVNQSNLEFGGHWETGGGEFFHVYSY